MQKYWWIINPDSNRFSHLWQVVTNFALAFVALVPLNAAQKSLPTGPIIAAWQNWGACNETQTLQAVERGVNVVFWFSTNLVKDDGQPKIKGPIPDLDCVARVRQKILAKNLPTAHLITVGGWDAPHPDTAFTGAEWFQAWHDWNQALPMPFDGFDWDLEGNSAKAMDQVPYVSDKSPKEIFPSKFWDHIWIFGVATRSTILQLPVSSFSGLIFA